MEAARFYAASAYWLNRMLANRAVSPDELRRRQISKLRASLSHARKHYPFYRARLEEAGIDPERFADLDDLRKLPPLDRETFRFFSESPETESVRLAPSTTFGLTSGSSGRPIRAYGSPGERARQAAKFFMALFLNGYGIRDKTLQISMPGEATVRDGWQRKLGVLGGTHVSGADDVTVWIDAYRRLRPEVLYSDLCHLVRMALYAAERGLSLARPKLCVSYGETMDGASRRILAEAFGGENTVQMYGSIEFGLIGFQTRTAPFFHLTHEMSYFELETGPAAESARGAILVTDLYPRPCPLIRYRLGDSVVFGLERGIPVLRSIIGRENDLIRLPDGSLHGSPVFEMVMERQAAVLHYRIVQSAPDALDIYIVARKDSDPGVLAGRIVGDLEREFSAALCYRVHPVPRIGPDPSGKLRALVSGSARS
jgi:phenylacetate-CoA ligase